VVARASFEGDEWGYAVLGGVDIGGGADPDIVIGGAPLYDVAIFTDDLWGVGIPQGTFTAETVLLDAPDTDFGRSITSLGDVTGDGLVDFAVGAHGDPPDHQRVYLYDGRAQWAGAGWEAHMATFDGPATGWVGKQVLGAVDMDADGSPELALGDPHAGVASTAGAFYLVEADDVDWTSNPALHFQDAGVHTDESPSADDLLGWSLAAGDVNGDGADELVVGAPATNAGTPGAVRIYSLGNW